MSQQHRRPFEAVIGDLDAAINACTHSNRQSTLVALVVGVQQCDQKKSPNFFKTCPKMILLEK